MWASCMERIDSALLGSLWTLRRANKILEQKLDNCCVDQFKTDSRLKCSGDDLKTMLTISIQRSERIENKAMGTLLGVAVAIAVFGATSGLLGSDGKLAGRCYAAPIVAAAFLIVAMVYLLASGLLALGAYRIGTVFRPELIDHASVTNKTHEKVVLLYSIEQNQRAATMRSNRLSASFTCLRNGLVVVLMLDVLILVAGVL